jgi:hypothetical protein
VGREISYGHGIIALARHREMHIDNRWNWPLEDAEAVLMSDPEEHEFPALCPPIALKSSSEMRGSPTFQVRN